MRIFCVVRGHRRDEHRTWHDGLDWRSSCRRCDTPMIRGEHRWRVFDDGADKDARRHGKPLRTGH